MSNMDRAKCRSCQADIFWIRTEGGHLTCLDAEPNPEKGNIVIRCDRAIVLKGDLFEEAIDGPRYLSHFATCPEAGKHRKKK